MVRGCHLLTSPKMSEASPEKEEVCRSARSLPGGTYSVKGRSKGEISRDRAVPGVGTCFGKAAPRTRKYARWPMCSSSPVSRLP